MSQAFTVVIPARFASQRLPGKPLLEIAGRPMIEHVWQRAMASGAARVLIATDNEQIATVARGFGAEVVMTREDHVNGTSRLTEVVDSLGLENDACLVNVQGDEPLLPSSMIDRVAESLGEDNGAAMATLAEPIVDRATLMRSSVVKVVCSQQGRALYFSRAPIPWDRDRFDLPASGQAHDTHDLGQGWFRHIGIYAYRASFLRDYQHLPVAPVEACEQLEQLRALYHGYAISVAVATEQYPAGVDTPEDLARVREWMTRSSD
ncbi:3-deoxy-manno-octulosonate cytidylyltransferase [Kushneria indalinina]|uniref:3-deoxy-manno-octulosonate cytidylyltransferase n=1 Tax=Kushneria indalinina DSM 14324 TaxID=1122140 RepID=A0A3D9DZ39_9GAMM|nr:3-deoxy-manno-octulosonate cytidylyltransferase [Kushneria indalinina]REC96066.1 3-deoxy-manno-octulosonate cytidylyltransferase (CMP-KDO synthetase) [Kushneria indalinina DSM 14324]